MKFKPGGIKGGLVGLILGVGVFALVIWAINFSLIQPDEKTLKILLLIPAYLLGLAFLYILFGAFNMAYKVDADGLTIQWATRRTRIPWSDLIRVIRVTGRKNLANLTGISWPGYMIGTYNVRGLALVKMYATRVEGDLVVVETKMGNFGLSPVDQSAFIDEVSRRSGHPVEVVDMSDLSDEVRGKMITEDMVYMGLYALNIVVLLGVIAYQAIFFPGSGASRTVVLLPALGTGVLAFNIGNASRAYQFVPSAAYLIWVLSLIIMVTFLVLSIVTISF